ncbi:hypothetical protein CCP3SC1_250020 [Gammaproteobacteria bacterium]
MKEIGVVNIDFMVHDGLRIYVPYVGFYQGRQVDTVTYLPELRP